MGFTFTVPSVTDFKNYFTRDFPYGTAPNQVQDQDITNAIADTAFSFNQGLTPDQPSFTLAYLLVTAHWLVTNLRNSSQGIAGQYNWLTNSKTVGNVTEAYSIPQRILDIPVLAMLSKTTYGAKYLQLILPQLVAPIVIASGQTQP